MAAKSHSREWEACCASLPKGWQTSYVGLFSARPGGLLRVNAHPAAVDAVGLEGAIAELGLATSDGTLELCDELLRAGGMGFDLQLDVDSHGVPQPGFGLEVYLEGNLMSESPQKEVAAQRVFGLLEGCGAADGRWRYLEGVDVSKQVMLPLNGSLVGGAVSTRLFSAKVKIADGRPQLGKTYLRGDGLVVNRARSPAAEAASETAA